MAITTFNLSMGGTTGIDLGKNLLSAYIYNINNPNSVIVDRGAYDKNYFSYDGSGVFTCKKQCSVRIVGIAGAVLSGNYANFKIMLNGNEIARVDDNGGWRVIDKDLNEGDTLYMRAYAYKTINSASFNVYLK